MIVAMLIKPLLPFFLGISNLMLGIVEVNSKLSPINLFSLTTGSGNLFILSSLNWLLINSSLKNLSIRELKYKLMSKGVDKDSIENYYKKQNVNDFIIKSKKILEKNLNKKFFIHQLKKK